FVGARIVRLGLPILMGMIVVVAPQTYFELRQDGLITPNYFEFWGNYLQGNAGYPVVTPTWNHLWYVVYLLTYVLLIWPFLPALRRMAEGRVGQRLGQLASSPWGLLLGLAVPFVVYEWWLTPRFETTHNLIWDWANHAHRLSIFLLGYFFAKNSAFWGAVDRYRAAAVVSAVVLLGFRLTVRSADWELYVWLYEIGVMPLIVTIYAWTAIVALLAVAQRHLNSRSNILSYFTQAVFCYYILHQTITVSVGYGLTQLRLGAGGEFVLLVLATVLGSALGYEFLRRVPGLRLFFGIQRRGQ
ncbi:MAG: acyltransferase family protein, partial [Myxococcota bacterium]